MNQLHDKEFGIIPIKRSHLAKYVRVRIHQNGTLSASLPKRAAISQLVELIEQSRDELRDELAKFKASDETFENGMQLGKSHRLRLARTTAKQPKVRLSGQEAIVALPLGLAITDGVAVAALKKAYASVLRKEAEHFLPRRVRAIAIERGFLVKRIQFNNAKTRWGSCTSEGNLNLNIALMKLPHALIDYVIIHELCHTKHLNHSAAFWSLVEANCPTFKQNRQELKQFHPYI